MGKLSDQIATLEQRLGQLKVQQQQQARRERTAQSQRERRDDTRRKILVGACVLTQIERGAMARAALLALLDPFLTRPDDRHLFGLSEGGLATGGLAAGTSGRDGIPVPTGTAPATGPVPPFGSRPGRSA